ncbi:MAG: hypothetical protein ACI8UO_000117 [Verrucomicrobiales bacterium]|jgi:hypothetical protein
MNQAEPELSAALEERTHGRRTFPSLGHVVRLVVNSFACVRLWLCGGASAEHQARDCEKRKKEKAKVFHIGSKVELSAKKTANGPQCQRRTLRVLMGN